MTEYTIDDIRGPTVAREMAQLKEFVLAQFNGAIADAEAAAAAAATAAANAVLANTVKKTGEASQSIAGDVAVTGSLDAASIGSGSTPVVCGNLTAFGNVSLDDTTLQGNLAVADPSALINLSGAGSVIVPTPTGNSEAATKKYVDDALDAYAPMMRTTGNQTKAGQLTLTSSPIVNELYPYLILKDPRKHSEELTVITDLSVSFRDGNNIQFARLRAGWRPDGTAYIQAIVKNADNTDKYVTIAEGNP